MSSMTRPMSKSVKWLTSSARIVGIRQKGLERLSKTIFRDNYIVFRYLSLYEMSHLVVETVEHWSQYEEPIFDVLLRRGDVVHRTLCTWESGSTDVRHLTELPDEMDEERVESLVTDFVRAVHDKVRTD